jgi:DNA-binding response OmpR family regulator
LKNKILLIEDEKEYAEIVSAYLTQKGFIVTQAATATQALKKISSNLFHLVILDLGLPDADGLSICRLIREKKPLPILILTAKDEMEIKIKGFKLGADDYLVKPASLKELVLRSKRLLKRSLKNSFRSPIFTLDQIKFDTLSGQLEKNNKTVQLTRKERAVLEYLLLNKGQVLTRLEIMDHVWGNQIDSFSKSVNVVVASLRKKVKKLSSKKYILSVHGLGYKCRSYD